MKIFPILIVLLIGIRSAILSASEIDVSGGHSTTSQLISKDFVVHTNSSLISSGLLPIPNSLKSEDIEYMQGLSGNQQAPMLTIVAMLSREQSYDYFINSLVLQKKSIVGFFGYLLHVQNIYAVLENYKSDNLNGMLALQLKQYFILESQAVDSAFQELTANPDKVGEIFINLEDGRKKREKRFTTSIYEDAGKPSLGFLYGQDGKPLPITNRLALIISKLSIEALCMQAEQICAKINDSI